MNDNQKGHSVGYTVAILVSVLPMLLWVGSPAASGQAPEVPDDNNEGWSNLLAAQSDIWASDLAAAGNGAALMVGTGHAEGGPFGLAVKIRRDGTMAWRKTYADTQFYKALPTKDGGFLLWGGGTLAKVDSVGAVLWAREYPSGFEDVYQFSAIRETADAGFIAAAPGDGYIFKLTPAGDVTWVRAWGTSMYDSFEDVFVTEDGYLAVGQLLLDPWLAKIGHDGTLVWQKVVQAPISLGGIRVSAATGDGNYIITASNDGKPWVAQVREDGTLGWQKILQSTKGRLQFNDMAVTPGGDLIFVGLRERSGDQIRIEGLVLAMDTNGNLQWQRIYQAGKDLDLFAGVTINSSGEAMLAGQSSYEGGGPMEAWLVQLQPDGRIARCPLVTVEQVTTETTSYSLENATAGAKEAAAGVLERNLSTSSVALEQSSICPLPHLSIDKRGPQLASGGVPFAYSLSVTNNHDEPLTGIEMRDELPEGSIYISGGERQGKEIVWDIGTLDPGKTVTEELTISARSVVRNEHYAVTCAEGYAATGDEVVITEVDNLVQIPLVSNDYCPDYDDDFSNPASGWPIVANENWLTGYAGGEYEILFITPGGLVIAVPACGRYYYEVAADLRWEGRPDAEIGLMLDATADQSSFAAVTLDTPRQEWTYWEITPGGESSTTYRAEDIRPGSAENHLRLIRERELVQVEINGVMVDTLYTAERVQKGFVGVVALADAAGSRARFDDFQYSWLPAR